jgi:NAD(P)-dependent dehydrogenase (short-subunit alcohol dehydrogenase family)
MITESGGEATCVQVDATSASAVEAMISKTVEAYGRLDCAHTYAGIVGGVRPLIAEYPKERWHQVIAVHLTGVWLCMKYAIPQMLRQGGDTMVNTASIAGFISLGGPPMPRASMGRSGSPKQQRWSIRHRGCGSIMSVLGTSRRR